MRLRLWLLVGGVGLGAGAVALRHLADRPLTLRAAEPRPQPGVRPAAAAAPRVEERFIGVVISRAAIDLAPRIEGRLKQLLVTVGQTVEKDAVIALLDDSLLRKDLKLAQATLRAAQARSTRASIELGDAQARSQRRLSVAGDLSAEEVAGAKTAERLGGANATAAAAAVEEQRAQVDKLAESLTFTRVRAPFSGKIATAFATVGAQLTPQTPIVRLVQNEELSVRFAVPAALAHGLRIGQRVRFWLEASPFPVPGAIQAIAPEVDPGSQMVFVEAGFDVAGRPPDGLKPGIVVRASLGEAERAPDSRAWQETPR